MLTQIWCTYCLGNLPSLQPFTQLLFSALCIIITAANYEFATLTLQSVTPDISMEKLYRGVPWDLSLLLHLHVIIIIHYIYTHFHGNILCGHCIVYLAVWHVMGGNFTCIDFKAPIYTIAIVTHIYMYIHTCTCTGVLKIKIFGAINSAPKRKSVPAGD